MNEDLTRDFLCMRAGCCCCSPQCSSISSSSSGRSSCRWLLRAAAAAAATRSAAAAAAAAAAAKMIHAFYIFHINRCIFIAQYPQRGSAAAAVSPTDAGAAAAAATTGGSQQQQHRGSSNGIRGASLREAAATAAGIGGQQQYSTFTQGALSVPAAAGRLGGSAASAAAARGSLAAASSGSGRVAPPVDGHLGRCSVVVPWGPSSKREQQAGRLLSGLLFSMRRFCEQIGPGAPPPNSSSSSSSSFTAFSTPLYKLHYLRTCTGYGFACLTSPEVAYLEEALAHIYGSLFVERVIKSPSFAPSQQIDDPLFAEQLHQFLASLPAWEQH
ncbi:hypothetical protein Esti_002287 [Eimeria stiedai]